VEEVEEVVEGDKGDEDGDGDFLAFHFSIRFDLINTSFIKLFLLMIFNFNTTIQKLNSLLH
jgi:hypothetical protein